jgi:hypothetical protein
MADDIPFDKNLDLTPDTVDEVAPGVRRVMADNPGPFTFKGLPTTSTLPHCSTPCATRP